MSLKITYKIVASLVGAALLVVLVITESFSTFTQVEEAAAARKHSRVILNRADGLLAALIDAESAMRGYLLTGDVTFLEPYLAVRDSIIGDLQELRNLTLIRVGDDHLDALAPLVDARLANISQAIELRRNNDEIAAVALVRSGQGKRLSDSIRTEMRGFIEIQEEAQAQRDAQFQTSMRQLLVLITIACLFALLFALSFVLLIYRETQQRLNDLVHLETQHLLKIQEQMNRQLELANVYLQIGEEKLAVTINSIGDAVLATDADGRVTLMNPLAEKLIGWTQEQAANRQIEEIFHIINQETRQPAIVPVKETLKRGTVQGLANHTVLIARDGSECAIADSCAPIRMRDGTVVGAVLVFRDVTEEYAKNAELVNARLVADKANLAKSDFLSNMSHEIRTPMNAIIGLSYLAMRSEMTPRQRDHIKKIQDSGRHLLGIINDILDFSKIEADKLTLEHVDFEMEKVLDNVSSLISEKTSEMALN